MLVKNRIGFDALIVCPPFIVLIVNVLVAQSLVISCEYIGQDSHIPTFTDCLRFKVTNNSLIAPTINLDVVLRADTVLFDSQ